MLRSSTVLWLCCATVAWFVGSSDAYSHLFGKPPQAVIHLPENVFKSKDRAQINHGALSEYLSGLKDIPNTLHEHGRILAQLDHSQLAQHLGQSVSSGRLPLISVTSNGDHQQPSAGPAKVAYELHGDGYASAYEGPQMLNAAGGDYGSSSPQNGGGYETSGQSAAPAQSQPAQPAQSSYSMNGASNGYNEPSSAGPVQTSYYGASSANGYDGGAPNSEGGDYTGSAPSSSGNYGSAEQSNSGGYEGNRGYSVEGASGYEMMGANGDSNSIAEYGRNYAGDSSPFDFNFVQDILGRVLQQLEQQQITPEQLQAYGELEEPRSSDNGNYGSESSGAYGGGSAQTQQSSAAPMMHHGHTVAFRVPTIRYELPDAQIEQLMQAISGGSGGNGASSTQYGSGSQPIPLLVPAGRMRLPTPLGMGSVRTIAVIKSARLPAIKNLPQLTALAADGATGSRLMYAASAPSALRVRHVSKKSSALNRKRSLSTSTSAMATAASNLKLSKKLRSKPCDEESKKKKKK
jgi:hypothetical protein